MTNPSFPNGGLRSCRRIAIYPSWPRFWHFFLLLLCFALPAKAQDKPYFVTYSHDLEEPGELELETKTALGNPDGGDALFGYGV